jgi:hypothetical protein
MKKLLLTTTMLTSLSNLTLADLNNDYYFTLQPELTLEKFTITTVEAVVKNAEKTLTSKADCGNDLFSFQTIYGGKIEFGKYLNNYLVLGLSSSIGLSKSNDLDFKIMPKLKLLAYKSDNTTISLGAGLGYHYKNIKSLTNDKDTIQDTTNPIFKFHGIIGTIDLSIAQNINPTTSIGLDLGLSYSKLSNNSNIEGLPKTIEGIAIHELSTKIKGSAIGISIGLSAQFSL